MINLLLILLILYIYLKCKTERFRNYRNIVISPKYSVYNPNKFIFKSDKLNQHIFDKAIKYFPITEYEGNTDDIIAEVDSRKNLIGITDMLLYLKYVIDNPNCNIRFICNLFSNILTILVNSKDLSKKKTICLEFKNSVEYVILNSVQKYYQFKKFL